jgi:hypothetical protein
MLEFLQKGVFAIRLGFAVVGFGSLDMKLFREGGYPADRVALRGKEHW